MIFPCIICFQGVRPRKNWMDVLNRYLKDMDKLDITWEEAEELTADREGWRQRAGVWPIWMRDEPG